MAYKAWQTVKTQYCDHVGCKVRLESLVVYPADLLPVQEPRILAHRCSMATRCNLVDKPSCVWSGTNPGYDPFAE